MMTGTTPPPTQTQTPPPIPQNMQPQMNNMQPQMNLQNTRGQMKETLKRQLMAKLEYKLHPIVEETTKNLKSELDTQDELSSRAQKLDQLELQMTNEEKQMDNDIETLKTKLNAFDQWIQSHEKKDIDVDKAIEPEDIYSKQYVFDFLK